MNDCGMEHESGRQEGEGREVTCLTALIDEVTDAAGVAIPAAVAEERWRSREAPLTDNAQRIGVRVMPCKFNRDLSPLAYALVNECIC